MTSNVGARLITEQKSSLGFAAESAQEREKDEKAVKEAVLGELRRTFRPEFLNRVDDIIVFHKLSKEQIQAIAALMLKNLAERLEKLEISLSYSPALIEHIADAGFDKVYGARPLRRPFSRRWKTPCLKRCWKAGFMPASRSPAAMRTARLPLPPALV